MTSVVAPICRSTPSRTFDASLSSACWELREPEKEPVAALSRLIARLSLGSVSPVVLFSPFAESRAAAAA